MVSKDNNIYVAYPQYLLPQIANRLRDVLTPTGCVNELIHTKALEARPMFIRQAKKKHLRYDCQDETLFTICRLQDTRLDCPEDRRQ